MKKKIKDSRVFHIIYSIQMIRFRKYVNNNSRRSHLKKANIIDKNYDIKIKITINITIID